VGSARTQAIDSSSGGSIAASQSPAVHASVSTLTVGLPAAIYRLVVLERKTALIFGRAAFIRTPLSAGEAAVFIAYYLAEVVILLFTLSVLFGWMASRIPGTRGRAAKVAVAIPPIAFIAVITAHFKVLTYMRDGIDLGLMRQLGGNNLGTALTYVRNEFAGLAPLAAASILCIAAGAWLLGRYGSRLVHSLQHRKTIAKLGSRKYLALMNGALLTMPIIVAPLSDPFHDAMRYSLVHQVYVGPATVLTDFDGDGYSFLTRPHDNAPFNARLNPYALDVPGNGIDEDGIGGDLPQVIPDPPERPWRAADLARKNVLLIVLESAREDLLDEASPDPMPAIRSTPGQRIVLLSHQGFTTPSVVAAMTGNMTEGGAHEALITKFKRLGYRTAALSGQNEGFGNIAQRAAMHTADLFADATSFPAESRLYSSTNDASLAVSTGAVNARFEKWLAELRPEEPFFAYMNWQALHFPYYWPGEKLSLIREPLQRGDITPDNRDRLIGTYRNAARTVDEKFSDLMQMLDRFGRRRDTVILITGDHGEELFDNGYLGHGTNLSYEQNAAVGKLINSEWKIPARQVAISDVGSLIYNALLLPGLPPQPLRHEVFGAVGAIRTPKQIGVFAEDGVLTKYDFTRNVWSRQVRPGAPFQRAEPSLRAVYLWESKALESAHVR
jgi:hypothetical protein